MKRALVALCLGASACASAHQARARYEVGEAFAVRLERPWADITRAANLPSEQVHLLTIHGVALDQLYLAGGLEPGESLLAPSRGREHPVHRADFSRRELVAFLRDSLGAMGYVRVTTRNVRPALFAGAEGVRFDVDMQTADGLDMSAMALAAQSGDTLNLILFIAPKEHYFPMLAPEIDRMFTAAASS
jgi:hypothetical protein